MLRFKLQEFRFLEISIIKAPIIKVGVFLFLAIYRRMIHLTQGIDSSMLVTLTERASAGCSGYLFRFTHRTTKEVVELTYQLTDDASAFPYRYNEFTAPAAAFVNATIGQYTYEVFEIDVALSPDVLETGMAMLYSAGGDFEPIISNAQDNTFKVYNG